ncbi:hypothetical protein K438DRAFT_1905741 [Mycena galopus ATCC 62051]|nr:hypothetical protein K438DRAFT_1905741 [Mycena galopus ATCC 62051]
MSNHALVFGASGISGWAMTNTLLDGYPTPELFSKVSALTNRLFPPEVAQWPPSDKLQAISGVDLLQQGGHKVTDVESVTHVYFFAFIHSDDFAIDFYTSAQPGKRAIGAIENLSKNLKFVVLPTGTKAYGVHLIDKFPFTPPLNENLPRIPEPYTSQTMFYYQQADLLEQMCENKDWTWCELRPDVIVGFVPKNNVYCLAQALAPYLSLYRAIEGVGTEDVIAKFAIFASLHPDRCGGGQAFNPQGRGSTVGGSGPQPGDYVQAHLTQWKDLEQKTGRVDNDRSWGFLPYSIMTVLDFDRQMDLSKELEA